MATKTEISSYVEPNVVHTSIPESILDDLCSRFLINLPEDEQDDMVRVFFQIELAHWYYIDFYCQEEQTLLPTYGLREFSRNIFQKFPFLNKNNEKIDKLLSNWKKYKFSVPVYGAILLNNKLDKCVLVQAYSNKSSWGFPRGKLNKDETPLECAIREVLEEAGFDITSLVGKEDFLELSIHDHLVRLYLVPNVPVETEFETKTRGEIKDIQWFFLKDLPAHKKDTRTQENIGLNPNNFFMVIPFVKSLKKWIANKQRERNILEQSVQSQPAYQLQRLIQSEDEHLQLENERLEEDRRRREAQERFLKQLDFYHPLRPQGYSSNPRKATKAAAEHDQKQFKILQRPGTGETVNRRSPHARDASPLSARSATSQRLSPSNTGGVQESNPSDSRSLSPSSNSAFTRVSRAAHVSPKTPRRRYSNSREKIASPSDSLTPQRTRPNDEKEAPCSYTFLAPAWTNFQFDQEKIIECFRKI